MKVQNINTLNTVNSHCTKLYNPDTNTCTIYSYNTPVLSIDEHGAHRHWAGWSSTTQRDINNAGYERVTGHKMTKAEWESMPVEKV